MKTPVAVIFRANGTALVKDSEGKRMHELEGATHADTIALLKFNGYNWRKLEHSGTITSYPVRR